MRYLKNKWLWITAAFWVLTPFMFRLAYAERGFQAIGGEIFFPLMPLIIWAIARTLKDGIQTIGKENKNG